ncbi:hypothetical protein L3073_11655 [Ancylomarina sp. DW003]|nr:PKD-like family lipoprotein [Ancylomarina sp. DW003]MDE5422865.1 hypothetical protein [Ancylomarina sp. DW003]
MKRLKILYGLVIVLLVTSCVNDEGNYDYKNLPNIDLSKIPSELDIFVGDTLSIKGDIVTSVDDNDLEFAWYFDELGAFDTISNEKDLHVFVDFVPGLGRNLLYSVYDTKNEVHHFKALALDVITPFSTGWAILKDKDGETEMDFISISNEGVFYEDVLATFVKEPDTFEGKPISLNLHWWKWTPRSNINIVTEYGGAIIDAFTMKVSESILEDKFYSTDYLDLPFTGGFMTSGDLPSLVANGKLYLMATSGDGLGGLWEAPAKGDYYIGNVGTSHIYQNMIFFDEKNRRYLRIAGGWSVNYSEVLEYVLQDDEWNTPAFDPANLGMDCIWMGSNSYRDFTANTIVVHVLKDDAGAFHIQKSQPWNSRFYALSQMRVDDGLLNDNSVFAMDYVQPYAYMSNGNVIHRFNHTSEAFQANYITLDVAGNITRMISSYDSKMLGVAVDNGAGSTILILDLENDGAVLETYEVDSKVVDFKYKEDL